MNWDGATRKSTEAKLTLKLGLLQHLDLPDVNVVQWVDGLAGFLNVLPHAVRDPVTHTHTQSAQNNAHKLPLQVQQEN